MILTYSFLHISKLSIRVMMLITTIFTGINLSAQHDHEGHTHSHGEAAHEQVALNDIPLPTASEASSDKYEVLLKFQPVEPGEELTMTLYLSNVNTNAPVDSAVIQIVNHELPEQTFQIEREEIGIYHIHAKMYDEKLFNLDVTINASLGADLIRLKDVDFTHHHAHGDALPASENSHLWLYLLGGAVTFFLGLFIGKMMVNSKMRKRASLLLIGLCLIPTSQYNLANAHEGEDHGPAKKDVETGADFSVLKESQFLMNILTQRIGSGAFQNSRKLYGTVIPSSNGQAVVSSPQAGKLVSVNVAVGEYVKKGQQLGVVERFSDVANEITYTVEKNKAKTEYEAAKKEFDRSKSLEDIAAKKQMDESTARLEMATKNLELYNSSNAKSFTLKAPIDGLVSTFALSPGTSVNAEEALFTIVNLETVYVEAQAFEKDVELLAHADHITVQCADENHISENVKLVSMGQEFNSTNQSQKILLSIDNKQNEFKLGEFVNVFAFSNESENTIAIVNSAITEIEGRPVVFVKNAAEQFELRYVAVGADNGIETIITAGIATGDRVVVNGAYQVKLIYLNK